MHQDKLGGIKERIIYHRLLRVSVASFAVFLFAFTLVPTLISEASATERITAGVNWSPVSLTIDPDYGNGNVGSEGHGDVIFDSIIPSAASDGNLGTMRVVKKTIGVETTGRYYTVYLSTDSSSNSLDLVGDTEASISPISATWNGTGTSAPKTFSGSGWGFAVPGSPIPNSFSSASTYSAYDALSDVNMTYANSPTVYNTGTWAAVPSLTNPQQIWKATTTNVNGFGGEHGDTTNNHFDVYYATIVDFSFVAGSYENRLIYTALANSSAIDAVTNNISRSLEYGTGGDTETLSFDLAQSMPAITKDKVEVYLVPHNVTNANGYVATNLDAYKSSTYKCMIGSNANDFTITNNKASLNCTIPENPDGKTAGGANMEGEYDFLITIPAYGYNYISKYHTTDPSTGADSEIASFIYAGLQTKKRNGADPVITEMQEMTPSVCKNTTAYDSNASSATTFSLKDVRDDISYNVRKLGDDCWMVDNLRFANASLDSTTSDVSSIYTPQAPLEITWKSLATGFDNGQSYLEPQRIDGVTSWYNFAGATATTIMGKTIDLPTEAQYSICPKGWRLASDNQARNVTAYKESFNLATYGFWGWNQLLSPDTKAYWTTASVSSVDGNKALDYNSAQDIFTFVNPSSGGRQYGFLIRCAAR